MEDEIIQEINKYKFIKERLEEYKVSTLRSMNILDRTISRLEKRGESICIDSYLKEAKNIRENISTNRNKIIYTLLPAIEEKLTKLKEKSMVGEEIL